MHNRIRARVLTGSIVLVVAAALTSCTAVESSSTKGDGPAGSHEISFGTPAVASEVKEGGTLVMGLSSEPDTLDPTKSGSAYSRYIFASMCEKLYDTDQTAKVVPQLATALPTASADGLTYTIPLRTDAVFADGTKMDAAAVAATLQRNITSSLSHRKAELGPLTSVDVVDASHVALHYSKPFFPLASILADRAGMIESPAAIKKNGEDAFGTNPVCVAPFKFSKWVPQTEIDLVKDPNYYNADKVHLDALQFKIMIDATVRSTNLRSGDIQVADALPTQGMDELAADKSLSILQSPSLNWRGLLINIGNTKGLGQPVGQIDDPITTNPVIRQALADAVDRDALVQTAFGGWYEAACSQIPTTSEYAGTASTDCPKYDPKKAVDELKKAGLQVPYPITIWSRNAPDTTRYLQALQAQVASAFTVTLKSMEETSYTATHLNTGDYQVAVEEWSGRVDPDGNITPFLQTGASQNFVGYSNPKMDDLLVQAQQTGDLSKRKDLYNQVIELNQTDNPTIVTFRTHNLTGVSVKVKGVQVFPDSLPRLAFAGFAK
jgi:peptide/nickel transport system substrate-binding protein